MISVLCNTVQLILGWYLYVHVFSFNLKGFSYIFNLSVLVLFTHSASWITSFRPSDRVVFQSAAGNSHHWQRWPVKMVSAEIKRCDSVVPLASTTGTFGMHISSLIFFLSYILQLFVLFSIHCL